MPVTCSIVFVRATPAAMGTWAILIGFISGLKTKDIYMPPPEGDIQFRPLLPLPASCFSAITVVPSIAPSRASFSAMSCVEVTSRKYTSFPPMIPVFKPAVISSGTIWSAECAKGYPEGGVESMRRQSCGVPSYVSIPHCAISG